MKLKAIILVGLLILVGFFGLKIVSSIEPRFSFSFPLRSGDQEIMTILPAGRYALVISTNWGGKTFGVIPPTREYSAQIGLEVRTAQGLVAQETNPHYLPFSLSKTTAGEVKFKVHLEGGVPNESVVLHVRRGF